MQPSHDTFFFCTKDWGGDPFLMCASETCWLQVFGNDTQLQFYFCIGKKPCKVRINAILTNISRIMVFESSLAYNLHTSTECKTLNGEERLIKDFLQQASSYMANCNHKLVRMPFTFFFFSFLFFFILMHQTR